jgi:Nuclear transport factor 2 (NTF2) domain
MGIEGISHLIVVRYFETMNAGDFDAASELFAIDGAMNPPFESQIVGRSAIAEYLKREARGIQLNPQQGKVQQLDNGCTEYLVTGRVQTSVFGVGVSWRLILSPMDEIFLVGVKLIATPKELLNLRRS